MYHFVDLSDQEKIYRREQLDWYGWAAHLSTLIPFLAVQIYILVSWLRRPQPNIYRHGAANHEQKRRSRMANGLIAFQAHVLTLLRRLEWYSEGDAYFSGLYLGTRGGLAFSSIWTLWLVVLSVSETGQDFAHLTARFGIIGASQLPLVYLLSLRTPFSPLKGLACNSLRPSMMLHRHLGTVVVVFFFLHSFMYFYMYICKGSVLHHLSTPFILYGVAGTSIFAVMLLSANRIFRAWSYRLFYAIHIVAAAILLPLLFFHGRYMRIYLIECIIIYGINSILRLWATRRVSATINTVRTSHSTLLDIRIPMTDHTQIWHPGQYALISTRGNPMSRLTGSTPLTIASLASDSEELRLMARVRNGRTKSLAKLDSDISYKFNLEGPYGSQDHISELLRCRKILLIAGGVGGTFILPIYRQLLKDFVARPKKHHLTMHWIARSSLDIAWAVEARNLQEPGFKDNLRVHITQGVPDANRSPDDNSDGDAYTDEKSPSFEAINDPLLMLESSFGRPCIEQMIADTFCEEHGGCTAIVVCGPSKLITHVRKETSAWVRKGRQCYWIAEKFES